jgi:hypothetical protein
VHLPPAGFHLQIRTLSKDAPALPDANWWEIGGSATQVAEAIGRRTEAGVTYVSVCSQDLEQLGWLAGEVMPLLRATV